MCAGCAENLAGSWHQRCTGLTLVGISMLSSLLCAAGCVDEGTCAGQVIHAACHICDFQVCDGLLLHGVSGVMRWLGLGSLSSKSKDESAQPVEPGNCVWG